MTRTLVFRSVQSCPAQFLLAGFTLLEILMVLAIIAMASVIVVPNLGGLDARTFNTQVREASNLLNYARRIAVVSGQPATASFSIGTAADEDEASRPQFYVGGWRGEGLALSYRDSADQEIRVDENLDITFFPEGGSTGGTLQLQLDDRIASIEVDPFSGRVTAEILENE